MTASESPAARSTGLLLIDLQNDFIHPDGLFARNGLKIDALDELLTSVSELIETARTHGRPIYWVTMVWDDASDGGLLVARSPMRQIAQAHRRNSWGAEIHADLDVQATDTVIEKRRFSAFFDTPLDDILQRDATTSLVVAGVRTDFCVESTVRDAFFRDYSTVVASEAVGGYFKELHANSLRQMATVFADVVPVSTAKRHLEDPPSAGPIAG